MPPGLAGVTQISAGGSHTCARKGDGTVTCWGYGDDGATTVPSGLTGVTDVSAGQAHACALKGDGTVTCWGGGFWGQTTVPSGLTGVTQISAGYTHTCARKGDGTATCWGDISAVPPGVTGITQISAGWNGACAAKDDGTAICWSGVSGAPGVFPTLEVGAVAAAVYGSPFEHLLAAEGEPAASVHALGGELPPGVTLDPATGTIAGTPTLAGSFTLRVAAFNVLGASPARPVAIAVARAPLTITANDKTVAAGAPLPGFDATVAGLVGADTLATPPTCSAPDAGATPARGSYPITCAGAVAANYAIDYQPGTLTVTAPAAVPVTPPAAPAAPAEATTLTIGTRRIVVIKRNTRNLPVTCTLDQPRLNDCTLTLKAGARTLATGHAVTPPGQAATTVTLSLTKRARKLARRPGGLAAKLSAAATQTSGPVLSATIPLLLLPNAVVSAPTDGLFTPGSAKLPRNGTPYLRRLRALVTGARQITCIGHTDDRGSTKSNQELGLQRARAVCRFLTRDTAVRQRTRSTGESHPRASNRTAAGRARNRYVSVAVRY